MIVDYKMLETKMIIDPQTIIGECLETAFDLQTYIYIIDAAKSKNFTTNAFRKKFNAFYRVRQRTPEWYDMYYDLMEKQRNDNLSFEEILRKLQPFGAIEVSFTSKLISTIDPQKPIWDKNVLFNLGLSKEWALYSRKPQEERIKKAMIIYEKIEEIYRCFLNSESGEKTILMFNSFLPEYSKKISNTKKIDFCFLKKEV